MARRNDQNAAATTQGTEDSSTTASDDSDRQTARSVDGGTSDTGTRSTKVDPGDSGATVNTPGDQNTDATTQAVQDVVDQETDQGFRGQKVDPTPNENYTLGGQAQGLPVPENERDTFTGPQQPVIRPTNAGEVLEDERRSDG